MHKVITYHSVNKRVLKCWCLRGVGPNRMVSAYITLHTWLHLLTFMQAQYRNWLRTPSAHHHTQQYNEHMNNLGVCQINVYTYLFWAAAGPRLLLLSFDTRFHSGCLLSCSTGGPFVVTSLLRAAYYSLDSGSLTMAVKVSKSCLTWKPSQLKLFVVLIFTAYFVAITEIFCGITEYSRHCVCVCVRACVCIPAKLTRLTDVRPLCDVM